MSDSPQDQDSHTKRGKNESSRLRKKLHLDDFLPSRGVLVYGGVVHEPIESRRVIVDIGDEDGDGHAAAEGGIAQVVGAHGEAEGLAAAACVTAAAALAVDHNVRHGFIVDESVRPQQAAEGVDGEVGRGRAL